MTIWGVINVRGKILHACEHLHKSCLQPVIGSTDIDLVASKDLQVKLLSLAPQTVRQMLMVGKTIWRKAEF